MPLCIVQWQIGVMVKHKDAPAEGQRMSNVMCDRSRQIRNRACALLHINLLIVLILLAGAKGSMEALGLPVKQASNCTVCGYRVDHCYGMLLLFCSSACIELVFWEQQGLFYDGSFC